MTIWSPPIVWNGKEWGSISDGCVWLIQCSIGPSMLWHVLWSYGLWIHVHSKKVAYSCSYFNVNILQWIFVKLKKFVLEKFPRILISFKMKREKWIQKLAFLFFMEVNSILKSWALQVQTWNFHKGPSIKNVCTKSRKIDPFPTLSAKCPYWLNPLVRADTP